MGDVAERVSYELVPLDLIDPDPDNLRREFPDLDKTAEGFETNFVNPGEPFNPPIVVRDGERFRLVDGERRWRAMRLAGRVRECHALVCDGVGAAEAVLAMLATDDKRRLTDEERDRGVQLALKVGVRPSEVDKAAGMRRGTAKRVMAGMRVAGGREYSQQTTEAYLLSLEHQGDDEILDLIAGYCGPNLRVAVDQVVRRRAGEAAREAVLAALDGAGVARGAAIPAGARLVEELRAGGDLEGLAGRVAARAAEGGVAFARVPSAEDMRFASVDLYAEGAPGAPAESANKVGRAHSAAKRRRAEWASQRLLDDSWESAMPNLCALARGWAAGRASCYGGEFFRRAGIPVPDGFGGLCPFSFALAWASLDDLTMPVAADLAAGHRKGVESSLTGPGLDEAARGYAALMGALAGDGYEPSRDEERLLAACRARIGREAGGGD